MLRPVIEPRPHIEQLIPRRPIQRGLLGNSLQLPLHIRKTSAERREHIGSDPAPEVPGVDVGRITPSGSTETPQMTGQIFPPERQQRADEPSSAGRHGGETGGP
ncbi:MAG TPA: hypothetical protein VK132_04310 [Gemmatimonadales bacterium]|nr:hypothetical protein [Gemmatimonadales bacterium]